MAQVDHTASHSFGALVCLSQSHSALITISDRRFDEISDRCVEVSGRPPECVDIVEKAIPELNRRIVRSRSTWCAQEQLIVCTLIVEDQVRGKVPTAANPLARGSKNDQDGHSIYRHCKYSFFSLPKNGLYVLTSNLQAFAPCFLDNPALSMEDLVKNIQVRAASISFH